MDSKPRSDSDPLGDPGKPLPPARLQFSHLYISGWPGGASVWFCSQHRDRLNKCLVKCKVFTQKAGTGAVITIDFSFSLFTSFRIPCGMRSGQGPDEKVFQHHGQHLAALPHIL